MSFPGNLDIFFTKNVSFELTSGTLIQPRIIVSPLYERYTSAGPGRRNGCEPSKYLVSPGEGGRQRSSDSAKHMSKWILEGSPEWKGVLELKCSSGLRGTQN